MIDYGFSDYFSSQPVLSQPGWQPGRVTAVHRELYEVMAEAGPRRARLSGGFNRRALLAAQSTAREDALYPTVGDFVALCPNEAGDWPIEAVYARRSKFARSDTAGHTQGHVKAVQQQVVAANFDTALLLTSMNRDFNPARIQRYVVAAWDSGALPLVVLTKADLAAHPAGYIQKAQKAAPGVAVLALSAHTGQGLEALAPYTAPGQTLALFGSSGVGKSSLVNALSGQEDMAVGGIREDDSRGRHTTTHRQMLMMPGGYMFIDTPGMRELGLWDAGQGLGEGFSDITALAAQCRFADCGHKGEPGCAVRAALESGALEAPRWESYLKLQREIAFTQRKAGRRARSPRPQKSTR